MKERPILVSAPMVRSLLAGTKTQTRRALRGFCPPNTPEFDSETGRLEWFNGDEVVAGMRCPYGQPGDRLWVREAWRAHTTFDHLPPREIPQSHVWYMADDGYKAESRTRASMHMPRWASRITLEVTGVRVERLQNITIEDAKAEGAWPDVSIVGACARYFGFDVLAVNPRWAYRMLWEQINGPGSWIVNPWVWVVTFRRLET